MSNNKQKQEPKVWNSTFFHSNQEKDEPLMFLDFSSTNHPASFLWTKKVLKYRKKAAKHLYRAAKKNFNQSKYRLANIGNAPNYSSDNLKALEYDLVHSKMVLMQTKEYYKKTKEQYGHTIKKGKKKAGQ